MFRVYAWQHRGSFAAGAVCLALTNYLTVSIPTQIGSAIDGLAAGSAGVVPGHAVNIALMGVAIIVVRTLSRVLFFNPGRDMEYALRGDLFARLLSQQPGFYAGRRTGDIVSRASNDISWTRALVGFGTLQAINIAMAVPLTFWKMFGISMTLTLAALVPISLGIVIAQISIRRVFPLMRRNQEELGEISNHVLESFQGIASIQGFVAEDAFETRFQVKNEAWFATGMRLAVIRTLAFPILGFSGGFALFILIRIGGPMAVSGALSVGDIAAFATLLAALLPPLRSMGFMLSVWQRGRAALERIFELMDSPIDRPEGDSPVSTPVGRGPEIVLNALTFAYPDAPDDPILHDISLTIPSGETVGIFGRTGSGKSTLVRLLSRLYNPPAGSMMVDGVDICAQDLHTWRRRLAVVPQRPFLFSDTIAANIALADEPAHEAVAQAAALAALDADLSALPDGLETVVGERGIMLSGGQRQRVALARGLHRQADVVVLDDVLSAVDHDNEARLVATLAGLSDTDRAPTTFIVSNRLSAFRYASMIAVLDGGRLVDVGTHEELAAREGVYRETWLVQQDDGVEAVAG
ncbi:MAG: ABC transporter ATP-binding protein [Myxococcota bacterium]|nr:ABC transporter ATP-binding protein [Myxococcota bacterium]